MWEQNLSFRSPVFTQIIWTNRCEQTVQTWISVDPDQMPCSVASDLDQHHLQGLICPNTKGY